VHASAPPAFNRLAEETAARASQPGAGDLVFKFRVSDFEWREGGGFAPQGTDFFKAGRLSVGKTLADREVDGHIQKLLRLNLVLGSLEVKGDEALEFPRIRDNLPPLILALPPFNLESLAGKAEIGIFPHTPAFTGKSKDIAFQRLFKNRGKREDMSREIGDEMTLDNYVFLR
jgi:hypothetical protein